MVVITSHVFVTDLLMFGWTFKILTALIRTWALWSWQSLCSQEAQRTERPSDRR